MTKVLLVETGSAGHSHAQTRFVEVVERPPVPVPSDHWTAPLVAARLKRIAAVFHRDRAKIWPAEFQSCMPTPILDRSRDYAPDTRLPRQPLTSREIDFAVTTFQTVLKLFPGDQDLPAIVWCIANRQSFEECAEELNRATWRLKRDWTRDAVRYRWAEIIGPRIVDLFNRLHLPIEDADVALATKRSFHRNL